jgi:Uma2 family endonuclease
MAAGILVPLEEYLSRDYEPDMDYDDGVLIERNVGKQKHSLTQAEIVGHLWSHKKQWGIRVYVEQRIQIAPRRFVVADVCAALASSPKEDMLITPPLFTIEILSPDDKFADIERKAQKYLAMGVRYVWSVDPETGRCWRHDTRDWMVLIPDSILRVEGTPIEIPIAELMREI